MSNPKHSSLFLSIRMEYLHSHSCILRRRTAGAFGHATTGLALMGLQRALQVLVRVLSFPSSYGTPRKQPTLRMRPQDPVLPPAVLNREAARWAMGLRSFKPCNMPSCSGGSVVSPAVSTSEINLPGDSLAATRPQERQAARDLLFLDCWVNSLSRICLD